jgi:hypothetical protein
VLRGEAMLIWCVRVYVCGCGFGGGVDMPGKQAAGSRQQAGTQRAPSPGSS